MSPHSTEMTLPDAITPDANVQRLSRTLLQTFSHGSCHTNICKLMLRIICIVVIVNTHPSTISVLPQLKLTHREHLFGEGVGAIW